MPQCRECTHAYMPDDGYDDDGLCHPCAHALVEEAYEVLGGILSLGVLNLVNHGITKPKADALFARLTRACNPEHRERT